MYLIGVFYFNFLWIIIFVSVHYIGINGDKDVPQDEEVAEVEGATPIKKKKASQNAWSLMPDWESTEESARDSWKTSLSAVKKKPKDGKLAKEFMSSTYILRRREILEGKAGRVAQIIQNYPPLGQFIHLT